MPEEQMTQSHPDWSESDLTWCPQESCMQCE